MAHKIFLIGGTGGTGLSFLQQALDAGHRVVLYARNPSKVKIPHPNLETVRGELNDLPAMKDGMAGCDVVVFTAGVMSKEPTTVISDGVKNVIAAAEDKGVKRFIAVTSMGLGDSWDNALFSFRHMVVPLFVKGSFADKEVEERYIMASKLDWTIIRPARLLNKKAKHRYRVGFDKSIRGRVAREDVAHFVLSQLDDRTYLRKTPCIAD